MPRDHPQAILLRYRRQDQFRLGQGEKVADTLARAAADGKGWAQWTAAGISPVEIAGVGRSFTEVSVISKPDSLSGIKSKKTSHNQRMGKLFQLALREPGKLSKSPHFGDF